VLFEKRELVKQIAQKCDELGRDAVHLSFRSASYGHTPLDFFEAGCTSHLIGTVTEKLPPYRKLLHPFAHGEVKLQLWETWKVLPPEGGHYINLYHKGVASVVIVIRVTDRFIPKKSKHCGFLEIDWDLGGLSAYTLSAILKGLDALHQSVKLRLARIAEFETRFEAELAETIRELAAQDVVEGDGSLL
jgi:hypothetical protein